MKSKVFAFLAVVLVLVTSLSFTGCGPEDATFTASDLTFSTNPVEVGTTVTIAATITNDGGVSGNYTATLNVSGTASGSQTVTLASKASQTVTFTYTPTTAGSLPVAIGKATGTLGVTQQATGYWDVKYKVVDGSKIVLNYSLVGIGGKFKSANLSAGDGTITVRINKTEVNGAREIILLSSGWQFKSLSFEDISPGVDMNLVIALKTDAKGVLYVKDGVGDVNMSSVSSLTTKPYQTDTVATGKKAPAGSMLVATTLQGNAYIIQAGKTVELPFGLTFTTGSITNAINLPKSKFNGATLKSQGTPFAKDGVLKKADYVGTAGTITTTGTGDCLGFSFAGLTVDFQAEIKLVLEPESVK